MNVLRIQGPSNQSNRAVLLLVRSCLEYIGSGVAHAIPATENRAMSAIMACVPYRLPAITTAIDFDSGEVVVEMSTQATVSNSTRSGGESKW